MDKNEIKSVLARFSLFRDLDDQELEKIIDISISREWKKNSHIFMQGDPLENVYFIHEGKVKIYKSDANGREQIVAILKKGEMFRTWGFSEKADIQAIPKYWSGQVLLSYRYHNSRKFWLITLI
ncbi:transcriptional regulator [Mesobacillus boroniphilus JCM 21738]|uniref:Transcriptional regulator n=1 Tax=Mesobacillus boroniphilus JCM 21738 TaxID=1294265 RepID=W4RGH9_9BACI|nr:transcriptional regulator [Mesobacillus boroniphilus JCM 21738]